MKYLCLVYIDGEKMGALSRSEMDVVDRDSMAYDEELERSGHYILANALQPVETAMTVRVRSGKVSTTDGPFAETKEHLGGFILIEAKDLNEAVRVASSIPLAHYGSIEVRPIMELKR